MSLNIDSVIQQMINHNNQNMNISFPAKVVGVERLADGFIDVQPIVDYTNPLNFESSPYPVIRDVSILSQNTNNTSIVFPVSQGDLVDLLVQSVSIQDYVNGNSEQHEAYLLSYGNLANVVALVGFTPYQQSPFNPNNYSNDFNNQDLNIVHNKGTDKEAIISINTDGDITLKSPTKVIVESNTVEVIADKVEANNAVISTQGDVEIAGKSVKQFMETHTHIGNQGSPTSPPNN